MPYYSVFISHVYLTYMQNMLPKLLYKNKNSQGSKRPFQSVTKLLISGVIHVNGDTVKGTQTLFTHKVSKPKIMSHSVV